MNGAINTISRSTYESGIIGQVPILDKFTRSNPLRKYIPFWPENNAAIFFHTANSAMRSFEDPESGKTESKSLLKSLLKAHRQYSDRFTLQDVLAISMGAVCVLHLRQLIQILICLLQSCWVRLNCIYNAKLYMARSV